MINPLVPAINWRFFLTLILLLASLVFLSPEANADAPAFSSAAGKVVLSLNGEWQSAQDLKNEGTNAKWFDPANFPAKAARPIQVPGAVSEVWATTDWHSPGEDNIAWYLKTFTPTMKLEPHLRYYLRFGAVMETCDVWLNGTQIGSHDGGEDPFEFDVTKLLQPGKPNTLALRVMLWKVAPIPMGGINQYVSIVAQPDVRIIDGFARPNARKGEINLEVTIENNQPSFSMVDLKAAVSEYKSSHQVGSFEMTVAAPAGQSVWKLVLAMDHPHLWNLDDPFLYKIAITSDSKTPEGLELHDTTSFNTGFREFKMVDGYFTLNGKRMLLKSTHANWYDPVGIQGTPRDMTWLGKDFPLLKKAGFNTMRFIVSAASPEQLDQADKLGFLIWSEHQTSWLLHDPTQFGLTLNQIVRRDRNHPSLALWGLLNETDNLDIYHRAHDWLPKLREIDDTRPVILSSGRWDRDGKTASISNAGSSTWDVYLGGEDPVDPKHDGSLGGLGDGQQDIVGDNHIYPHYPLEWGFATGFDKLDQGSPHPFLFSESGLGSLYDAIEEKRQMIKAHAPSSSASWKWINHGVEGSAKTWSTYGMAETYPNIEDVYIDSEWDTARQRNLMFNVIRANPMVNGHNLTSLMDCWGGAEGIMNCFREMKHGHLKMLQEGWAPLRWCLFVNPMNVYADAPMHIKVALANEDVLPVGDYLATLEIKGKSGVMWKQAVTARVQDHGALAYTLFDDDIHVPNLKDGAYTLEASLNGKPNAAASKLVFNVATRASLPKLTGNVTVAGVRGNLRDLLTQQGAKVRDYVTGQDTDHEVIVVGPDFTGKAADWRALYARAARGAHIIFTSAHILHSDKTRDKWLALPAKGDQDDAAQWLYHKFTVAKVNRPEFAGLPAKLMTGDFYEGLIGNTGTFQGMTPPAAADTAAISIYNPYGGADYVDGVMMASYPFHAGRFTITTLNISDSIGLPPTDRLLLNLVAQGQKDAAALAPLPADYDAEMDKLDFRD
jgi:hypothetical protein